MAVECIIIKLQRAHSLVFGLTEIYCRVKVYPLKFCLTNLLMTILRLNCSWTLPTLQFNLKQQTEMQKEDFND